MRQEAANSVDPHHAVILCSSTECWRQEGRCGQERVVRGTSTKNQKVDRLEAPVVRTLGGAGCQATDHIHLGSHVNVVARF